MNFPEIRVSLRLQEAIAPVIIVTPDTKLLEALSQLHSDTSIRQPQQCVVIEAERPVGYVTNTEVGRYLAQSGAIALQSVTVAAVMCQDFRVSLVEDLQPTSEAWHWLCKQSEQPLLIMNKAGTCLGAVTQQTLLAHGLVSFLATATPESLPPPSHSASQPNASGISSLACLIDQAPNIVWLCNPEGRCTFVNQRWLNFTGRSIQEALGNGHLSQVHPDDVERYRTVREEAFCRETSFQIEYRLRSQAGEYQWILDTGTPQFDKNGQCLGYIGSSVDISDRQLREDRIAASEHRYRTLVECMNEGVVIVDADGVIQFVNDRYCEFLGYHRDELIGRNEQDVIAHKTDETLLQQKRKLRQQDVWDQYEVEVLTKNGESRWWLISGSRLLDDPMGIDGSIGIITDISDRKQTEQQLQQLTQFQQGILDAANYTIISTDPNGIIQSFNATAQRLLGYAPEEVIGKVTPEIIHDASEIQQRAKLLSAELGQEIQPGFEVFVAWAKRGLPSEQDWTYISKTGRRFPVELSVTALRSPAGEITGYLGIGRDISAQRQLEAERWQLISIVENSSDLMGIVSLSNQLEFLNQAGQHLLGLDSSMAVCQTSLPEIVPESERSQLEQQILPIVAAEGYWSGKLGLRTQQTGTTIPALWNLFLIRDAETGAATGMAIVVRNITDLLQTQAQLAAAEARFRRLFANVPGMIYQYVRHRDGTDSFPFVGYQCEDIFELTQDLAQQDPQILFSTTHPDDVDGLEASTQQSIKTLQAWRHQWRILTPSGQLKWIEGFAQPERQENGDILWDGILVDVSDRQRAQIALTQQYQKTINILESMADACFTLDHQWHVTYANPQALQILQIPLEDLLNRSIWDSFPEAVGTVFDQQYRRAMTDQVTVRFEHCYAPLNRWFSVRAYPTTEGLSVFFTDISDRHQLQEERNQFFNLSLDIVGIAGLDGYFCQVNPAVTQILGYTQEEFMAVSFMEFVHPEDQAATLAQIDHLSQGRPVMSFENRYRCKDGRYRWLAWKSQPVPELRLIYTIARDVTEQKQVELELRRSQAELEQRVQERTAKLQEAYQQLTFHVENSPLAVIEWDHEFRVIGWSPQASHIFGWTFEEICGQTPDENWKFVYEADLLRVQKTMAELLDGHTARCVCHNRNYAKDGSVHDCEWYNSALFNAEGQLISVLSLVLDITDRRRVIQSMLASEQRFATAFHASPVPLSITTFPESCHLDVNQAWTESTGYQRQEALGQTSDDLNVWADEDERDRFWRTLDEDGHVRNLLMHFRTKSGDIRTVLLSSDRIELDDEPCLLSAIFDITDRIQAEEELRLLQTITQAIIQAPDLDTALEVVLRRICQVTRWNLGEVWIPGDDYHLHLSPAWFGDDESLMAFRQVSTAIAFPYNKGLPGRVWATQKSEWMQSLAEQSIQVFWRRSAAIAANLQSAFGVPILANGDVLAVCVFFTNISRKPNPSLLEFVSSIMQQLGLAIANKQAVQELRDSNEFSERLLDSLQDGFSLLNAHGVHLEVNQAFCNMTGFNREDLIGVAPPHPYWPDDELATIHQALTDLEFSDDDVDDLELIFQRQNGQKFPVIVSPSVLRNEAGEITNYLALIKDISLIKHIQEELQRSRDELEQRVQERTAELGNVNRYLQAEIVAREQLTEQLQRSNQELEQFAYVASHDLQEPLRAITSYTQLLAKRYRGNLDEKADKYINYIVEGATYMQQLIQDLLLYSRAGRHALKLVPVELDKIWHQVQRNLAVAIAESQATLTHDPLPTVMADAQQLTQLLQNLIGNAIKYRRPDIPPVIHLHVAPSDEHTNTLEFRVQDNGIGIESEYLERIFIIFQRLHTRRHYSGTGIGLAVCQKIVERHGGRIWAESIPNQGSQFCFTLPTVTPIPQQIAPPQP